MKKALAFSGGNLYTAPAQPASGRQGGPRLGLPYSFHRELARQVKARRFSIRFGSSGTLGQERDAGVAKATSRPERSRQRSMPVQGLGCHMLWREQSRLVEDRRFPTRFGSSGTLAGVAGRTAFVKYAG